MSFALPGALALLAAILLVVLFALLRTRQRRREVATFFVWRQLRDSMSTRSQRLRALLDPLLLLQIATIAAAAFAVAQPLIASRSPGLANLAIVIDASASMSTRMDSGATRYETAVRRADDILATCPTSSVSVVLLCETPRALVVNETSLPKARKAVAASSPTWESDGDLSDLVHGLAAVGGASAFEQIIVLSDHGLAETTFPVRLETFHEGTTAGITAFSVRENPDSVGVSAFAELYNGTAESQTLRLEVTDEKSRTTVETFLEPGERSSYVVPFPTSRGSRFTASIAPQDAFPYDDVRYASMDRGSALRVRWVGKDNRYLAAALNSVANISRVDADPVDLTVVYDATLNTLPSGNVLLVHSSIRDLITLSARTTSGIAAAGDDDPLLSGIRADDIYAEALPLVDVLLPYRSLLTLGEGSFALRILDPDRLILVLPSDLTSTNLPITVDFPLLIRNVVGSISAEPTTAASRWTLVGQAVPLGAANAGREVSDPQGQVVPILSEQRVFFPALPGQYSVRSADRAVTVSVNIDPGETAPSASASPTDTAGTALDPLSSNARQRRWAAWPFLAGGFFLLLAAEFFVFRRREEVERRRVQ
jgi:hypothetical protein